MIERIVVTIVCVFITAPVSFCEPPDVSFRDSWRYINFFDKDKYDAQLNELSNIKGLGGLTWNSESLQKVAKTFGLIIENDKLKESFSESVIIEGRKIRGYEVPDIHLLNRQPEKTWYLERAAIREECWAEQIDTSSLIGNRGNIRIEMHLCKDSETAKMILCNMIITGNKLPMDYLNMYKIENSPGDVCLVEVNKISLGKKGDLSDKRIAFIRGNVAVYLSSYYRNIGCWDLACKLDALLVEQMSEKQQKEK